MWCARGMRGIWEIGGIWDIGEIKELVN